MLFYPKIKMPKNRRGLAVTRKWETTYRCCEGVEIIFPSEPGEINFQGNIFSRQICYMSLMSKCRGDWDLRLIRHRDLWNSDQRKINCIFLWNLQINDVFPKCFELFRNFESLIPPSSKSNWQLFWVWIGCQFDWKAIFASTRWHVDASWCSITLHVAGSMLSRKSAAQRHTLSILSQGYAVIPRPHQAVELYTVTRVCSASHSACL